MKDILQTLESPDKRHKLILEREYSFFDAAFGEIHDIFNLKIRDGSLFRYFFPIKQKIGESHYCYDGSSLMGFVTKCINIQPENNFAEVILKTLVLNNYENSEIKTHSKIDY